MEIDIYRNIMDQNDLIARANMEFFEQKRILAINVMASPGAGKTTIILNTIESMKKHLNFYVIEGDIASRIDADLLEAKGIPVVQINTGGSCHLDANMIRGVLNNFAFDGGILFIENVGNLVCPANFYLGEHIKLVILSVSEGHDKPFKYPSMFLKADAVILNKMDLISAIDFDKDKFYEGVSSVNPYAPVFEISCKTGEGIGEWLKWMKERYAERYEKL